MLRYFFARRFRELMNDFKSLYPILSLHAGKDRIIEEGGDVVDFAKANPDYTGFVSRSQRDSDGKRVCLNFLDQSKVYPGAITNISCAGGPINGINESSTPAETFNEIVDELEKLEFWLFTNRKTGECVQAEPVEYRVQKTFAKETSELMSLGLNLDIKTEEVLELLDQWINLQGKTTFHKEPSEYWDGAAELLLVMEELLSAATQWIKLNGKTTIHKVAFGSGTSADGKCEAYVVIDLTIDHYPKEESRIKFHNKKTVRDIDPFEKYMKISWEVVNNEG